jgi:hypothetical protein
MKAFYRWGNNNPSQVADRAALAEAKPGTPPEHAGLSRV